MDPIAQLNEFEAAAVQAIQTAGDAQALEAVRIEYLGARQGKLKELQNLIGKVPRELKPAVGKRFNEVKNTVSETLERRQREVSRPVRAVGGINVTLPGVSLVRGARHPLSQTIADLKNIMGRFGFTVADGPEVEDEWHNFVALNVPEDHPARDPLDNFYLSTAEKTAGGSRMLRSQTSTVQIRVMERAKPPIRVISIGRVYRPDTIDATHSCMFHQIEGLMVGEDVTMAQLKTTLRLFATAYLGHAVHIRFRPSFFPFTEPSVEVDMTWGNSWMELGGAGMVDPNVLNAVGYDPEKVTGFAFGLGVERFAMRRYNIPDIRLLIGNDLRFLRQF